jgi:uncharacterized protein YceH (UPF0502 family)
MDLILSPVEVRVLGSMVEKEATMPEYYPLSLTALRSACNQKSSRDPVVAYSDEIIERALDGLRQKNLVFVFYATEGRSGRVARWGHILDRVFNLERSELSALCILMLRGPQTAGEIRQRAASMHNFLDLAEVETALGGLIERDDQILAVRLPVAFGTKEPRYAQALSGPVTLEEVTAAPRTAAPRTAARRRAATGSTNENERLASIEDRAGVIREQIADLRRQFAELKKQFQ